MQKTPPSKNKRMEIIMKQPIIYWLTIIVILLALKIFSKGADADTLRFLLLPVATIVSIICDAPFLWEPHTGYISHDLHFLIAASCSGINFMIITAGILLFSFKPNKTTYMRYQILWIPISLILSYGYTILTNSVRIVLAIYVPFYLGNQDLIPILISSDTLHTLIGTFVYFSSLLFLSSLINHASVHSILPAFLWYIGIVWALPLASRIAQWNFEGFGEYTLIVFGSCIIVSLCVHLLVHLFTHLFTR